MFGLGVLFILIGIIGIFVDGKLAPSLPVFGIGAILILYEYYKYNKENKQKEENKTYRDVRKRLYQNHCWNCHNKIDSYFNRQCPKCNRYYICDGCGKCLCDSPSYNKY